MAHSGTPANFHSLKPPDGDVAGHNAGKHHTRLRMVIKSLPTRTAFAVDHEPEDAMPELQVWYVAVGFQWKTNSAGHTGTNASWIDAAIFRCIDGSYYPRRIQQGLLTTPRQRGHRMPGVCRWFTDQDPLS